jgi:hypothetical protein
MGKDQLSCLNLSERLHSEDFAKGIIPDIDDIGFSWVDEPAAVGMDVLLNPREHILE